MLELNKIYQMDCIKGLKELKDSTIQTVITSPPYWGLRDYGHKDQIGLEDSPEEYVNHLVEVFKEIKRVLKKDGTIWLNLGDTYYSSGGASRHKGYNDPKYPNGRTGEFEEPQTKPHKFLKAKDLCGIPFRVAFALQERLRLYLRQAIIWHKPNAMPSSVTDRPTTDYEFIFLLSKSEKYYYDFAAIREENKDTWGGRWGKYTNPKMRACGNGAMSGAKERSKEEFEELYCKNGRNCRAVWTFNTVPYPKAHFAIFPEELPERCIKAGTKEGDVVLDPFAGSGTTLWVAKRMKRKFVGFELNQEYINLCKDRTAQEILNTQN